VFVLTVDQQRSRRTSDQVEALLDRLARRADDVVRAFERTAGDEVQGVVADPGVVVGLTLELVRDGSWSIGLGIGPVDEPLPPSTRAGSGPAFLLARASVTRAKSRPTGLAVSGALPRPARHVQAVLDLLAATVQRRSALGWEAVDLAALGLTQVEIAERLGISKQAVSQRLQAADWHVEPDGRALASHLLSVADGRLGEP
jgi:hypothetical protein